MEERPRESLDFSEWSILGSFGRGSEEEKRQGV
jgi:hypothetical protein